MHQFTHFSLTLWGPSCHRTDARNICHRIPPVLLFCSAVFRDFLWPCLALEFSDRAIILISSLHVSQAGRWTQNRVKPSETRDSLGTATGAARSTCIFIATRGSANPARPAVPAPQYRSTRGLGEYRLLTGVFLRFEWFVSHSDWLKYKFSLFVLFFCITKTIKMRTLEKSTFQKIFSKLLFNFFKTYVQKSTFSKKLSFFSKIKFKKYYF